MRVAEMNGFCYLCRPMRTDASKRAASDGDALKGLYFHSIEDGVLHHTGQVAGRVTDDLWLVHIFGAGGNSESQVLVSISFMQEWLFYTTPAEMEHSYDYGPAKRFRGPDPE